MAISFSITTDHCKVRMNKISLKVVKVIFDNFQRYFPHNFSI